jgi:hypothetical protein
MRRHDRLLQCDISRLSGEVAETDHVEDVSGQTLSGSGSIWTDVRRELWIRPSHGTERRFTFTNVAVPARKAHRVTVLIGAARPVAIINLSTEEYVNLVTSRDFELFEAAEAFAFATLLLCAGLIAPIALVALMVAAGSYALVKWSMRQQRYREAARLVETEIRRTIVHPTTR